MAHHHALRSTVGRSISLAMVCACAHAHAQAQREQRIRRPGSSLSHRCRRCTAARVRRASTASAAGCRSSAASSSEGSPRLKSWRPWISTDAPRASNSTSGNSGQPGGARRCRSAAPRSADLCTSPPARCVRPSPCLKPSSSGSLALMRKANGMAPSSEFGHHAVEDVEERRGGNRGSQAPLAPRPISLDDWTVFHGVD